MRQPAWSAVLQQYIAREARRHDVRARVERERGRPFIDWSRADYADWMRDLDLDRDDDLWQWSHVTGIPIVGLSRESTFFFVNAHLLADVEAALAMPFEALLALRRGYDPNEQLPTLERAPEETLQLRDLPTATLRRSSRTGRFLHDEDHAEPRIVFEALAPYLVELAAISVRPYLTAGLRALPLSMVKAYRGKAIYLTSRPTRGYAIGMPVSNSTYKAFAGMQPGFFIGPSRAAPIAHNVVHEFGHVIDYTAIAGQYGNYLHHYQFPALRKLEEEKARIFGRGDAPVVQTDHGYLSDYAKTNAQENFAEHFAGYVLDQAGFRQRAEDEQSAGHPELMNKYRFIEKLATQTPVTIERLSREYLERLEESAPR